MLVIGPFEKPGVQATFESIRWTGSHLEVSGQTVLGFGSSDRKCSVTEPMVGRPVLLLLFGL